MRDIEFFTLPTPPATFVEVRVDGRWAKCGWDGYLHSHKRDELEATAAHLGVVKNARSTSQSMTTILLPCLVKLSLSSRLSSRPISSTHPCNGFLDCFKIPAANGTLTPPT